MTLDGHPVVVAGTFRPLPRHACGALVRSGEGHVWLLLTPIAQLYEMTALTSDAPVAEAA